MTGQTIAVRELAEFCFRSGDIDYRYTAAPTGQQGIEGHQWVQSRRPSSYVSEYAVEETFDLGFMQLTLRGRADGFDQAQGLVEEIKTSRRSVDDIPASVTQLHEAQLELYAALICRAQDLSAVVVRLTYFNIDTQQEQRLERELLREPLERRLLQTLDRYASWLEDWCRGSKLRDESIHKLNFPHSQYRLGQRELAETTYKCISQGGQLMLQAPTGIGKTVAVLYPALKAIAAGKHRRLAFLTARTVGRRAAEDTVARFNDDGLSLRSLSLNARESVCLSPGKACHGDDCPYAAGYYDRLPVARAEALSEPVLNRESLLDLARRHTVCPYELAVDLMPWMDLVIADINYVYSLNASVAEVLSRDGEPWSVLLDEAHNLPDRARAMYSGELSKALLMAARKTLRGPLKSAFDRFNRGVLVLQKLPWSEPDFDSSPVLPEQLLQLLQRFSADISAVLAEDASALQAYPQALEFYFSALHMQRVCELFDTDFRYERIRDDGLQSLRLRLNCLDSLRLLRRRQSQLHALVAFSATLSPQFWMARQLGLSDDAVALELESPFAAEQLEVVIETAVDTRFKARRDSLERLQNTLLTWLQQHSGNCLVYFPSYQYLNDALPGMEQRLGDRCLMVQRRTDGQSEREALLEALVERRNVVAMCILGGVFGEGIDLPGDQLSSVVVIGVGLPQFNREREQLRQYFEHTLGRGFDYAYLYPGMQKVNQALGRVVRTDSDCGRALLIDARYANPDWRNLLPHWWHYQDIEPAPDR